MKIVPKPKEIIFFQGVFENVLIKNVLLNNFDDDRIFKELKKINPNVEKSIFNSIHSVCLDTFPGYKTNGKTITLLDNYDRKESE